VDADSMSNQPNRDDDRMSRGAVITSFLFGGLALLVVGLVVTHIQNAPPPPVPPRITIVNADTIVTNPFSIRFITDQPIRNGPLGIEWGSISLHAHLMVDSMMFMPGTLTTKNKNDLGNEVVSKRDTFFIPAPHLTPGQHTLRLFWANVLHANVGDTATIRIHVIK
jgi:hypothetical protein